MKRSKISATDGVWSRYDRLRFDRPHPRVLRIVIENGRLNTIDSAMHEELAHVWLDVDRDPSVSAVIITGAGNAFSAGGDFKDDSKILDNFDARAASWRGARDLVYNMINCSKPIVSAIRGPAAGAGIVCALLADISVAAKNAVLVDGHTRLGVAAGDHAAIIWPLLCGMAKAKYYLLLCDRVSGEEAERIGLVSLAVEETLVEQKSVEIAARLAEGPPSAIRWTKYALNNWLRQAGPIFDTSLALEFLSFTGPEAREGLASWIEKRSPSFPPASPI